VDETHKKCNPAAPPLLEDMGWRDVRKISIFGGHKLGRQD
jgi:hypothetical protein